MASLGKVYLERVSQLKQLLETNPAEKIPELQFLTDRDWLWLAGRKMPNTEDGYRRFLSMTRLMAEQNRSSSTLTTTTDGSPGRVR